MPQCDGCSRPYRHLDSKRCEPCSERSDHPKPRTDWSLCGQCSKRFEFLAADECLGCQERNAADAKLMPPPPTKPTSEPLVPRSQNRDLDHAMTNPTNPRAHSAHGTPPYVNSFQSHEPPFGDENDPRRHFANEVYGDYKNGYVNAHSVASTNSNMPRIPRAKFRGTDSGQPTKPPVVIINVVIRKIENRHKRSLQTDFDATITEYDENRRWADIEQNIIAYLDGLYSVQFDHRIRSRSDFSIQYLASNSLIHAEVTNNPNATLHDVWKVATQQQGLHVLIKDFKNRLLVLGIKVNYGQRSSSSNLEEEDGEDSENDFPTISTRKRKANAAAGDMATRRPQKLSTRAYFTNITRIIAKPGPNQDAYTVKKCTVTVDPKQEEPCWTDSDQTFTVIIDKSDFASGKTKKAFKLRFADANGFYAAKAFYDLGPNEPPSSEDNELHLKEELIRQITIGQAVEAFNETSATENIAVYDLKVAEAFLLWVCEGPNKGQAWLVDSLLDHRKMRKFSGTDTAGDHQDLAGKTCDAFAHFCLLDTEMEFVAVDIQGIDTEIVKEQGIKAANVITLFDIMAHSQSQSMGLGDAGLEGIKTFCTQHKCNSICKKLQLPSLEDELKALLKGATYIASGSQDKLNIPTASSSAVKELQVGESQEKSDLGLEYGS